LKKEAEKREEEERRKAQAEQVPSPRDEEELQREELRMAKAFGMVSPRKGNESKNIISPRSSTDHKPTSIVSSQPVADEFLSSAGNDDEEERKEAARMAKMFGGGGGGGPLVSPRHLAVDRTAVDKSSINNGLTNSPDQAQREAERFSKAMGVNFKKLDPQEEARERERKEFEKRLNEADTSDPRAFSRQFLNDPEMLARLKDVKGIMAVQQLKGTEIPGHRF
jgi:hypothetical protein